MVESERDSMTYYLSQGRKVPSPKDQEQPQSFNQSKA